MDRRLKNRTEDRRFVRTTSMDPSPPTWDFLGDRLVDGGKELAELERVVVRCVFSLHDE